MIKIPGQYKLWRQTNISDIKSEIPYGGALGELWSTFNIDTLEVDGKIRLGKKMIINANTTTQAAMTGAPVGFRIMPSGKVYTVSGKNGTGYVFRTGSPGGSPLTTAFTQMTSGSAPTTLDSLYSDIESRDGILVVTKKSESAYWLSADETTWTLFNIFGDSTTDATGFPHMMTTYGQRMYCTWGGNNILSWDLSGTGGAPAQFSGKVADYSLQLGNPQDTDVTTNQILWMRSSANRIWIGTMNTRGGKGYVYSWDGKSNSVTSSYRMESSAPLACVIKDDVPHIIDMYGSLLKWNGGTFTRLANLNMVNNRTLFNPLSTTNNRFIHPNGMSIVYGTISALIDGRNYDGAIGPPTTFTNVQTIPSGIYQYDPAINSFFHKHSLTTTLAANPVTQDYGQAYLAGDSSIIGTAAVGGISELLSGFNSGSGSNGSFLAGGSYTIDSSGSTVQSAVWYDDNNDTVQKAGYFITGKIQSTAVSDDWQKIFVSYRRLLNSTDKIVVKYRVIDTDRLPASGGPASITATSTSQFTTTSYPGVVGDEVEIVSGINAGICAHITAVSLVSGTYTVTVDEPLTSASGQTSRAYFQAWTKIQTVINDQLTDFKELGIGKSATWIQFKVWMLFTGPNELQALTIQNVPAQKAG